MNLSFSLSAAITMQWWGSFRPIDLTKMSTPTVRQPPYSFPRREALDSSNDCKASLIGVIESQIIPRLLEAHPSPSAHVQPSVPRLRESDALELKAFADLCLYGSAEQAIAHVDHLIEDQAASHEDIFLGLIAPTARLMGTLWEEDVLDFTQVTLGLMRLQQISHRMGYEYQEGPQKAGPVRRVMLACAPGSQHILGLAVVSEFFRKDGWQVVVEIAPSQSELCRAAQNEWFDLIGFSVGLVEQLDNLPDLIRRVKLASRNPNTPVLLGGPAFASIEVDAHRLGANAICVDPREGLKLAAALVDPTRRTEAVFCRT